MICKLVNLLKEFSKPMYSTNFMFFIVFLWFGVFSAMEAGEYIWAFVSGIFAIAFAAAALVFSTDYEVKKKKK